MVVCFFINYNVFIVANGYIFLAHPNVVSSLIERITRCENALMAKCSRRFVESPRN